MATRTRRILTIVTAIGLVAVLAAPTHAAGERKKRKSQHVCGGRWAAEADCKLRYAGGHLTLHGNFKGDPVGYVVVTLEAIDATTGLRVPVLKCESAGNFGGCVAVTTGSPTIDLKRGQKFFCTVSGKARGRYGCSSD